MYVLRKCYLLLLIICVTTCEPQDTQIDKSPCEILLDTLEACIGGRPSLMGTCTDEEANRLLKLSCADIISNLRGE